ncbi:MAG: tRNA(Met) cytidine acetyltransferase [Colwellia sp.]|nr:tRNA(Met) cytidine acetyltransferase [Colwellia sp.]
MLKNNLPHWLEEIQCQALANFQRQLVLLIGDVCWVNKSLKFDRGTTETQPWLVYAKHQAITATVDNKNISQQLGSENSLVFFSCVENKDSSINETINLDAFAALSGTLVAGGLMVLWLEQPLEQAIENTDLLSLKYFYQQLINNKNLTIVKQNDPQIRPELGQTLPLENLAPGDFLYQCKTQEQQSAVEHVITVSQGHRNRPLVLTADRGRGKSSALAIACVELIENNSAQGNEKLDIVITAPHVRALSVFYRQLGFLFEKLTGKFEYSNTSKTEIYHSYGSIKFIAVDQLLHNQKRQNVSLLLVDEAAGIPVHLLTQLTTSYSRIVFASTVHGYEGAGRGFTLKFQQKLQLLMPQWRSYHINEPIRWRVNDPLERFVFDSCLLNAQLAKLPSLDKLSPENIAKKSVCFSQIPAKHLIDNTKLLQKVFAVLVTAHYQTSPNDIALMLDNEAVHIVIAEIDDEIIGVALLLAEGCENEDEVRAIASNQRRLKNQFIPQSLLTHCGFSESFDYQYLRILRIAIHPQYHRCGFGQRFMAQLRKFAKQKNVDFVGASFGANAQLLKFWQNSGYQIARIGFTKDQSSGEHSALVIVGVSDRGQFFERKIINEFYNSFDYLLTDEYQGLSAKLVWQVMHHCPIKSLLQLSAHQWVSISDFIDKKRQYSHCVRALHYWLLLHCKDDYQPEVLLLIERILQKKTVEQVCINQQLTGKKMLNNALIDYIAKHQK